MALAAGTRLGAFKITGQLGGGGMGEVYRATDTKLGRDVAIKTLPAALAGDKGRLARFEREAKLLAALNHPHIATIHGLDEHDGTLYLAMELVEGETLEEKLKPGALSVDDALSFARQIAEALEAAHGKGVVHRDLKPANVMLTRDGQVKVLDFGLAKAFSGDAGEASPTHSPAPSPAMTQAGLVLGTAGYMSPEQATGQATDQRADIWAFGVVLYEMLTGLPAFKGESAAHILADVLKTEPDWNRLPAGLHPRLEHLLKRCLTKKPRNRLHSAADARIEIEAVLEDPDGATPKRDAVAARRSRPLGLVGVAATVAVALAAGWFLRPAPAQAPGPVTRFSVPLPPEQALTGAGASMIDLSPDGTRIVYVADDRLYLRSLDNLELRPIEGTETTDVGFSALTPTFSPDGQWIVHTENQRSRFVIKRLPATGGTQVLLREEEAGRGNFPHGISWPLPDTILFANAAGIVRMPANGGAFEVIVARRENERQHSPQLLPGGDAVLFTSVPGEPGFRFGGFDDATIVVQSIGGDDRTVVWERGSAARYLPTGHLVYVQGTTLFAIPFDPATRAVRGGPVPLVSGLRRSLNQLSDAANFAISDTGTLVYLPAEGAGGITTSTSTSLTWVDREGREEPLPLRSDDYTLARISPDGTRIALVVGAGLGSSIPPSIWIYDLTTRNLSLLTTDPAINDSPVWSADSRSIYFQGQHDDSVEVLRIDLETGETTVVAEGTAEFAFPMPWSLAPSEDTLALVISQHAFEVDIATLSLADGKFTQLLFGEGERSEPALSPNGAWLAHTETSPGGESVINIRPFPAVSRTRTPVGFGSSPVFSRDGSELFFYDGRGIAAVEVGYEPTLQVGEPRRIVDSDAYKWFSGRTWDPDPSGERFLVIRNPGAAASVPDEAPGPRIEVVLNWFEELKSRVPVN